MRPVITPQESARLDAAAGDRIDRLMANAGHAVALEASRMGIGYGSRVVVLAGKGNNGGDGHVAARLLRGRGAAVTTVAFGAPRTGTAAERAFLGARRAGVRIVGPTDSPTRDPADQPDLVIDAVFGAGFTGVLPDEVAAWTGTTAPVLAVDLPSGLDATTGLTEGPVFHATRSVTFHALKTGHILGQGPGVSGTVVVADIGLVGGDPSLMVCEDSDAPLPVRPRAAHKWSVGSVAVVGGSPGLTGAPLLAARSALRFGAGAVTILCPAELQPIFAAQEPGVMSRGVGKGRRFGSGDVGEVVESTRRFDVVVLGPGLGLETGEFVPALLAAKPGRVLVDADGLNAIGRGDALALRDEPTTITPHAGEFTRLTGAEPGVDTARRYAALNGVTLLLKGAPTFVVADDGSPPWAVTSGGPELATIGTGDVLSGMVAALWARGLDATTAARSAAHWHGRTGADLARRGTVTAADLTVAVGTRTP